MSTLFEHLGPVAYDDEIRLVERATGGDQTAFVSLYQKYYSKVFSISKGILLSSEEAEDAVQEIFALAYRNLHRFDKRSKFSTWLFRIAVNRSIQESRKNKFRRTNVAIGEEVDFPAETPAEEHTDPMISEALAKVPATDRAVLSLFYWDELSLHEVGESLGCSPNAAKTRLFRARERFKEAYEELTK